MSSEPAAAPLSAAALAPHYSAFRVGERVLLTGHSHQAWPDVARDGMLQAFDDAAALVDGKWSRALEKAGRVRAALKVRMDDPTGDLALGSNTHELLVRLLSALPLRRRPRLVTTDGEFHTVRRQLARLGEEGVEVATVASLPAETVGERLAAALDERTAAVIVSAVFFDSGRVANLGGLSEVAERRGVEVVVDAYHAVNAIEFSIARWRLDGAYVLGGGYKYLQLGEGNCFLRTPPGCSLRPAITGWFADFGGLSSADRTVRYGTGEGERFAGATYDPTSHYRAAAVLEFFDAQGLTISALRRSVLRQLRRLVDGITQLDVPPGAWELPSGALEERGAFLVLRTRNAGRLVEELARQGIHTDHRGEALRLGPAPYVTDEQLDYAISALGVAARGLS